MQDLTYYGSDVCFFFHEDAYFSLEFYLKRSNVSIPIYAHDILLPVCAFINFDSPHFR